MKHRSVLLTALGLGILLFAASPAFAERGGWHGGGGWHDGGWRGGWHGGWGHEGWHRGWYGHPYWWGPRAYYAPPPVYYGYPSPSLTLTFP